MTRHDACSRPRRRFGAAFDALFDGGLSFTDGDTESISICGMPANRVADGSRRLSIGAGNRPLAAPRRPDLPMCGRLREVAIQLVKSVVHLAIASAAT